MDTVTVPKILDVYAGGRIKYMIHIGPVQTALCVSVLEAVHGAIRPPEMKLPIKWPNAPTGGIVIELQETAFAKRGGIW